MLTNDKSKSHTWEIEVNNNEPLMCVKSLFRLITFIQ